MFCRGHPSFKFIIKCLPKIDPAYKFCETLVDLDFCNDRLKNFIKLRYGFCDDGSNLAQVLD
jgi:hypothetical protein